MGGGGEVDTNVANLEKSLSKYYEMAKLKLRAAQKSIKRHYDLHNRERQYN